MKIKFGTIIGLLGAFVGFFFIWLNFDQATNVLPLSEHQRILEDGHIKSMTVNAGEKKIKVYVNKSIFKDDKYEINKSLFASFYIVHTDHTDQIVDEALVSKAYQAQAFPIFLQSNTFPYWVIYAGMSIGFLFFLVKFLRKKQNNEEEEDSEFQIVNQSPITFNDIAGLEEAKAELVEIVNFLKDQKRYNRLGAKLPTGVLLAGEPGTGKTLLAKAVAGEAGVSFIPISGADFVEVFVGVGSSRVRELFRKAKENAPCIIFIDEIDALGRARGFDQMGSSGNHERENTLNSLLVEMDGFTGNEGTIIIGATNRPDILDSALTRAGRFDRIIFASKPDMESRKLIFELHLRNILTEPDIDLNRLSELTSGASGADIFNICNEAALLAGRLQQESVTMPNLLEALERQLGGIHSGKILSKEEKKVVAIHESGHALCSYYLKHATPFVKVSIIPRGQIGLGYTQYKEKDSVLYAYNELLDQMCVSLGGRVAEEIVIGDVTTAASVDLKKVNEIARKIVVEFGMSPQLPNASFTGSTSNHANIFYADTTLEQIDREVQTIVAQAYERTKKLLSDKRNELLKISEMLMEVEVLSYEELDRAIDAPKSLSEASFS